MKKLKTIAILLIVSMLLSSCLPYKDEEVLFDYVDLGCLYYTKDEYKEYRYKDYILDDISNGAYKKSTPNLADYKLGNGLLDYDIQAYVNAKMDFAIKNELIKQHEKEIDSMCMKVFDESFMQRNSYLYYYDKKTRKTTLLSEKPVTNLTYDDEVPMITFDVEPDGANEKFEQMKGRKIKLSDIIAANTTLDGFMKVILATGKEKHKFYMDREMTDDVVIDEKKEENKEENIATNSEIN